MYLCLSIMVNSSTCCCVQTEAHVNTRSLVKQNMPFKTPANHDWSLLRPVQPSLMESDGEIAIEKIISLQQVKLAGIWRWNMCVWQLIQHKRVPPPWMGTHRTKTFDVIRFNNATSNLYQANFPFWSVDFDRTNFGSLKSETILKWMSLQKHPCNLGSSSSGNSLLSVLYWRIMDTLPMIYTNENIEITMVNIRYLYIMSVSKKYWDLFYQINVPNGWDTVSPRSRSC